MATYQNSKALNNLTLGKSTEYCSEYNPNLLQAVPRSLNRDDLSLQSNNLPFIGEDVWYGYELSWLNNKGKPVVAVAEFRFACTSPNLVESKSFKLYLNSFNQSKFDSINDVEKILIKDLSATAKIQAEVTLFTVEKCPALAINPLRKRPFVLMMKTSPLKVMNIRLSFLIKHKLTLQLTAYQKNLLVIY